ncbi:MAG TPA: L-2-hydroxyglutarate oxidase [Actinobacteria bacterium]|nr:L-2-hydroxyglutarate oxidase [Actinomycetota bacterium]
MSEPQRYDVCIVGAGLVGLAVGTALVESHPGISLLVLEKEARVAAHQSSHNSGVVHSGLYYRPGSLKARLCAEGRDAVYQWCADAGIGFRRSGKLVVATRRSELPALDELERRGRANGLTGLIRLDGAGIADFEPAATGLAALHVPEAGVADYPALAAHLAARLESTGARVATSRAVTVITHEVAGVAVVAGGERFGARVLVNCAGLHSDRVAAMAGIDTPIRIVPFRGEYYRLAEPAAGLVRALVYPVPDPRFPFLGVHFTRRIDGTVEVGPNAVLALGREHYRGTPRVWSEVRAVVTGRGFRRLALRHWRSGLQELITSRSPRRYARLAQRLVPAITAADLLPGGSGVRAQAVGPDGALIDDFVIEAAGSTIHVLNAPSPGATASPAIGRHVAALVSPWLGRQGR